MRSRYKVVEPDGLYFVTSTIVAWIPVFHTNAYFDILVESLVFCRASKGLHLYAYVIMDNHFHLLVSAPDLSGVMQSLKRHTAQRILKLAESEGKTWLLDEFAFRCKQHKLDSDHQVWQEGFHPQLITSDEMLQQKVDYIHNNPVLRGYVDVPEHWRYSSARNYFGCTGAVIEIDALA